MAAVANADADAIPNNAVLDAVLEDAGAVKLGIVPGVDDAVASGRWVSSQFNMGIKWPPPLEPLPLLLTVLSPLPLPL